ncbi:integral membrane protein [Grosmannia clavigera kw1407]|uniref:Integral membrane protein n=1 Tax=Grosmannia clavigera (strain kw1407 / UAMH 11150) TaxID=655863 RepID=F0XBD0_GROCL|nr:uncharacterized protein CMQ_5101 [Grosmannia clavigera kw1407]EFX04839.1 integral membrane protein [Grosmannia clavigera kw1407]
MADMTASTYRPDYNRGPQILIVCGTLVGVSVVMVSLRIWVRATMIGHVGRDDYCMVAAVAVLFTELMVIIPEVKLGGGRHKEYIHPPENIVRGLHLNFVTQPLCLLGLLLTKVSVGFFLLRMTPTTAFRRFIKGTIVFTSLSATGNLLTVFFQCRPLAFTWDASVAGGSCIPSGNLKFAAFFNSSVSVLTDLIFALLPIPMLWKVRLNWKTKAAVAAILSLGIFATIAGIVKITFLGSYGKHGDFLFDSVDITIWTTVEICAAMVAGCFPALKPMFKTILAGRSSNKSSRETYARDGYIRNIGASGASGARRTFKSHCDDNDFELFSRQGNETVTVGGRMGSTESILQTETPVGDGITKTTQVVVTVDEQQEKSVKNLV